MVVNYSQGVWSHGEDEIWLKMWWRWGRTFYFLAAVLCVCFSFGEYGWGGWKWRETPVVDGTADGKSVRQEFTYCSKGPSDPGQNFSFYNQVTWEAKQRSDLSGTKWFILAEVLKMDCWRQGKKKKDQVGDYYKIQAKNYLGLDQSHKSRDGRQRSESGYSNLNLSW